MSFSVALPTQAAKHQKTSHSNQVSKQLLRPPINPSTAPFGRRSTKSFIIFPLRGASGVGLHASNAHYPTLPAVQIGRFLQRCHALQRLVPATVRCGQCFFDVDAEVGVQNTSVNETVQKPDLISIIGS